MIDTIFFDLDDTLLDFTENEHVALCDTLLHFGIADTPENIERYIDINRACWQRLERGEWTREEVLVGRFRELYTELGIDGDPQKTQRYYENRLSMEGSYIDGAERLLSSLREKYRLYAVTNGTAKVQSGRIAITGVDKYLDGIFISEHIGHDKPQVEYFDAVFKVIGGKRENAIIVGDSLTSDIRGGINAGIRTVYYNPKGLLNKTGIHPDYEIGSFDELLCLLEKI